MNYYVKAIYALVVAVLGALTTVLVGDIGISDLTNGQWAVIALAGVVAFGGIVQWQKAPATVSTSVKE